MGSDIDDIGRLAWYAECMERALREIRSFTPPASDVRFHHSLFIINFMSLIDLAAETFDPSLLEKWERKMHGVGNYSGANNVGYLRELRNAVVHRGLDITYSGEVIEGHVRAIAPPQIADRFRKKAPFLAFSRTLFEVFEISRYITVPILLEALEPAFERIDGIGLDDMRADSLREVEASQLMPDWAKKMARDSVDDMPFEDIRSHNSSRLRMLLS